MTYTGNGQALLGRGGRQQRTGAAEQNPFQLSGRQLPQKVAAQGDCAAPAAGTACVDILLGIVKNHTATVHQKIYGHLHGAIFMEQV